MAGWTGLYFRYEANMYWLFGWHVSISQWGAYDYWCGNEEICGARKRHWGDVEFKSKFQALLFKARVNKQQIRIKKENDKFVYYRVKK